MTWAKQFVEEVTSEDFQMLADFCRVNYYLYGKMRASQEALNEVVESYLAGKLDDEGLFAWVKANVANEGSNYARMVDNNPAFRYSTKWPWYSEWWYKLVEDCKNDTMPNPTEETPAKKARGRKKQN